MLTSRHRQTIKGPTNPLDKSTVVSIFPKAIKEEKPTISPGIFEMGPGSPDNPQLLVVGASSWWIDRGHDQPIIEIPNWSVQVADSIVKDYCNAYLGYTQEQSPGLFWLPGEHKLEDVKKSKEFKATCVKQERWMRWLVDLADGLWAASGGHPLTISEDMRISAKMLGMPDKEWMHNTQAVDKITCVACGALRNPKHPICGNCHYIVDKPLADKLGIVAA